MTSSSETDENETTSVSYHRSGRPVQQAERHGSSHYHGRYFGVQIRERASKTTAALQAGCVQTMTYEKVTIRMLPRLQAAAPMDLAKVIGSF